MNTDPELILWAVALSTGIVTAMLALYSSILGTTQIYRPDGSSQDAQVSQTGTTCCCLLHCISHVKRDYLNACRGSTFPSRSRKHRLAEAGERMSKLGYFQHQDHEIKLQLDQQPG